MKLQLKEVASRASADHLSQPLFKGVLTDKQWHSLANIQKDLHEEYRMRREMLIKRLDVTIQSFQVTIETDQKELMSTVLFCLIFLKFKFL